MTIVQVDDIWFIVLVSKTAGESVDLWLDAEEDAEEVVEEVGGNKTTYAIHTYKINK